MSMKKISNAQRRRREEEDKSERLENIATLIVLDLQCAGKNAIFRHSFQGNKAYEHDQVVAK